VPLEAYYHQGGHGGDPPMDMKNKWFSHFLYGVANGVEKGGPRAFIVREPVLTENMSRYLADRIERKPDIAVHLHSEVRELWPVTDPGLPAAGAPEGANQYRWKKFKYAKKVVLAEVDPDHAWNLEVPRTDNSFQAQPNKLAADKWYLRWVVWIQNVLMGFSYFS